MWRAVLPVFLVACVQENSLDVRREPPEAAITAPLDGAFIEHDVGVIPLLGNVSDLPDLFETLTIGWTVGDAALDSFAPAADGAVASSLDITALPLGLHTISLFVTDSDDNTAQASVTVEVIAPSAPPLVQITAPADDSQFVHAASITFTGTAIDANDDVNDLALSWASSIDGPLSGATSGGGLSFLTTTSLSAGEHTIVLSATDLDGDVGSDSIVVFVGEIEDPPIDEPDPGEIIFSELMINPSAHEDEVAEWVEVYNVGDTTLDIGGYRFHDLGTPPDEYTLQGSVLVPPHGYAVLCANLDPQVNGGAPCDGWFERLPGSMALGNNSDEVVLSRLDGTEIDRLVYTGSWVAPGMSVGLDPARLDGTQNDDIANWCPQVSVMSGGDKGTPGVENNPCE